jgi:hypothetical protein
MYTLAEKALHKRISLAFMAVIVMASILATTKALADDDSSSGDDGDDVETCLVLVNGQGAQT